MATDDDVRSVHNTLSSTTADTVKLTQFWDYIEVTNRDAVEPLYLRQDGTTAVGAADGTTVIQPGESKIVPAVIQDGGTPGSTSAPCHSLSIVGDGNNYSVEGIPR